MQINWFTVIAQFINFLVLVWLMKKYLYKPILNAIDEREKKIGDELKDAKSKMAEAKKEQSEFQKKNDAFDRQKKKMMDKATSDAADEGKKLLDTAINEAEIAKQKMEDASKEMQENLKGQLAEKTQQQVFSITKKALSELASTNLEAQTIAVFNAKLKSLDGKEKKQFIDAFHTNSNSLSVISAFEISEKEQKILKAAIKDLIGESGDYEFKTDKKIISGIELTTKGYKLSWSFSAYIDSLEKSIQSTTMKDTHQTVNK
jgi:F-type H+-transporting ATPase subunit b